MKINSSSKSDTSIRSWLAAFLGICVLLPVPAFAQQPTDVYNYQRVTKYTYSSIGQVQTQTEESSSDTLCSTTTYAYDGYGNRTGARTSNCSGATGRALFAAREVTNDYAAQAAGACAVASTAPLPSQPGSFPTSTVNTLGHKVVSNFDPRFGVAVDVTSPNCLTAKVQLDDFGRTVRETRSDGTSTVRAYCLIKSAELSQADLSSNSSNCPASLTAGEVPANAVAYTHVEPHSRSDVKDGAFTRVYVDAAGNVLRTVTEAFDGSVQPLGAGRLIVQDNDFNQLGTKILETQPYFLDTSASVASNSSGTYGMSMSVLDVLGRPATIYQTDPKGSQSGVQFNGRGARQSSQTRYIYDGLMSKTINDLNLTKTEERNIDGQLIRVTDAIGAQMAYQYDAFGNLIKTKDPLQNVVSVEFDIRGNRTKLRDPDSGTTSYAQNALGETVWQQSANQAARGQSTTFSYDGLGRMTARSEGDLSSTWTYDRYADGSGCPAGIGKLCESSTDNGVSQRTYYDTLGRPTLSRRKVSNGPTFTTSLSYDLDHGRIATMTYPSGLRLTYGYTTGLGYLETVSSGSTVFWRGLSLNAWGRSELSTLGNGVQSKVVFDPVTGRTVEMGAGVNNSVFHHTYDYDGLSNLTRRVDSNGAGDGRQVEENYHYDNINRLDQYIVSGAGMAFPQTRTVDLRYNEVGSLRFKTDVGIYSYPAAGSARPHAVASIEGPAANVFGYDDNGNMITASTGKYRRIGYTSFDLPDSDTGIEGRNGTRYTWVYDADHARIKEVRTGASGTRTTYNVHPDKSGGLGFEQEIGENGSVKNRQYISVGGDSIGMVTTAGAISNPDNPQPGDASAAVAKIEYWHKDHLGSISAITDNGGAVTQRMAYDPFGKRRVTDGSYDAAGNIIIDNAQGTDRGFTGHENLDDVGVVHMNGRIYDSTIGRVMQADPYIQAPDNLQSFDRYSYVMNNPLNATDPSGELWGFLKEFWHWISSQGVSVSVSSNPGYKAPSSALPPNAANTGQQCNITGGAGTFTACNGAQSGGSGTASGNISVSGGGAGTAASGHPAAAPSGTSPITSNSTTKESANNEGATMFANGASGNVMPGFGTGKGATTPVAGVPDKCGNLGCVSQATGEATPVVHVSGNPQRDVVNDMYSQNATAFWNSGRSFFSSWSGFTKMALVAPLAPSGGAAGAVTEISYGVKATRYSSIQLNVNLTQAEAIENLAANGFAKALSKDGTVTIMSNGEKVYRFYPASTGAGVPGAASGVPSASISILDKIITKLRFIGN